MTAAGTPAVTTGWSGRPDPFGSPSTRSGQGRIGSSLPPSKGKGTNAIFFLHSSSHQPSDILLSRRIFLGI